MTTAGKWVVGVVVVAVIALGAYYFYANPSSTNGLPYGQNTASTTPSNGSGLQTSPSDSSDAALDQDSASIDTQMQGLNQDSANVNSSLNDQPVQQQQP